MQCAYGLVNTCEHCILRKCQLIIRLWGPIPPLSSHISPQSRLRGGGGGSKIFFLQLKMSHIQYSHIVYCCVNIVPYTEHSVQSKTLTKEPKNDNINTSLITATKNYKSMCLSLSKKYIKPVCSLSCYVPLFSPLAATPESRRRPGGTSPGLKGAPARQECCRGARPAPAL